MKSAVTLATVTTEFLERPGLAPSTRETYELTLGLLRIEELCSLMGHESIQTTLRYAKVTSQKSESAARHALNILINSDQKADL
ncbi:site-specific recombinase XerD-like protein [Nostoc commune NIES-4072]|uniref:Site-specific recombinase XerD-like protein n=1 Tax=Nostoc commune NIES-4072 TaxID=2005467 RepID=A0A2R5FJ83_NOSCO|nr:hypothetical protein [Nostoc commune]BBD63872.1 site-specific recombinase XerD-like protein [Nostoc commune HK-02]GBG18807.1 site-specific recombinase XerD-like protein [Nostoc commune NIES-4072]